MWAVTPLPLSGGFSTAVGVHAVVADMSTCILGTLFIPCLSESLNTNSLA